MSQAHISGMACLSAESVGHVSRLCVQSVVVGMKGLDNTSNLVVAALQ